MKIIIRYVSYDEVFYTKKKFFKWINKKAVLKENIYKHIGKNEFLFRNCNGRRSYSLFDFNKKIGSTISILITISSKFGDICAFMPHNLEGYARVVGNQQSNGCFISDKLFNCYYIEGIKIEGNDFEKASNIYKIKNILKKNK